MAEQSPAPIPFVNAQESGLDELSGASPVAMNIIADRRGCVRRRPGIVALDSGLGQVDGNGIVGLHVTLGGQLYAVATPSPAQGVYYINGNIPVLLGYLNGTLRPTIAETEALLLFAAGAEPRRVDLTTAPAIADLGGAPPFASHLIANNTRLVANDMSPGSRTQVFYSNQSIGTVDFTGHEEWPAGGAANGGVFTAEARPDPVSAITENTNEVFVWGDETLQVFAPDASFVYSPVATREIGCSVPHSIVKSDENFLLLDHLRRFVRTNGRGTDLVGGDVLQKLLHEMPVVTDCFGYRVQIGACDAAVWKFPTDGRTFVFQSGVGWGQWSGWNGNWTPFPVTAHHLAGGSAINYVGLDDGRVGQLSLSSNADFGETINAYVRTGFTDRGTNQKKWCKSVRVTLRRGEGTGEASGQLSYRDNTGEFFPPLQVSLGASGDRNTTVEFRGLGTYETRQWQFQFNGEAELVLVRVEEEFEVI